MKTILGIDPGYGRMGYGVIHVDGPESTIVEAGCVETDSDMKFEQRLSELFTSLSTILQTHQPTLAGVEELFFSKNVKTAMRVAHARGVILLACEQYGVPIWSVSPGTVKQSVAGYGNANKQQVQLMTKTLLGLSDIPKPDDAADALAIAIAVSHIVV